MSVELPTLNKYKYNTIQYNTILFSHHTSSQCCKARRFDRVALENGWGNPVETSCLATLTAGVVRKKY